MDVEPRETDDGATPSRGLVHEESRARVRAALEHLGSRDREVFSLRFLEGLDTAETARVLGIGQGAVKSRLPRAPARFRDLLDEGEDER
jgi:RNA polymerase sigma-70 factor (ECF subfamily)